MLGRDTLGIMQHHDSIPGTMSSSCSVKCPDDLPLPAIDALHLCDRSLLPMVCYFLSTACEHLLVLTPHKRPHLQCPEWGFKLVEERVVGEREREARTRARLYKSVNL